MPDIAKFADLKELVGSFVDFEDEDHEAGKLWLTREVMTYRYSASKSDRRTTRWIASCVEALHSRNDQIVRKRLDESTAALQSSTGLRI